MAIYKLHDSHQAIELKHRGLPPVALDTVLVATFISMFAGLFITMIVIQLVGKLYDDWVIDSNSDILSPLFVQYAGTWFRRWRRHQVELLRGDDCPWFVECQLSTE